MNARSNARSLEDRANEEIACDQRDEALAAAYALPVDTTPAGPPAAVRESLADTLRGLITGWTEEEMEAAREPWPHAFQDRHTGLFPVGEVSILAAAGREGKTTVKIGAAVAMVTGHTLGDLAPIEGRSVIVYSAEDDRAQYARKVAAQVSLMGQNARQIVMQRLLVPNLDDAGMMAAKTLVMVLDGHPVPSGTVEAIIEAIRPLQDQPVPPGLLIFETASTLSDAEETNPGFRTLILALKRIARELSIAVVLSHHVSQASLAGLADLTLSTTDIRGGTALVNNARQTALLVNLGSDEDPFPEKDARTILRHMACPNTTARVTALVSLDSSKGITPPPIFFRWEQTDFGPAAIEEYPPPHVAGKPWRKVHEMVRAERAAAREEAKAERTAGKVSAQIQDVLDAVAKLERGGQCQPVTARRIREVVGMGGAVMSRVLAAAVADGHLSATTGKVRGNEALIYRLSRGTTSDGVGHES
jgi:hypothetical protein